MSEKITILNNIKKIEKGVSTKWKCCSCDFDLNKINLPQHRKEKEKFYLHCARCNTKYYYDGEILNQ